jgi:nucleoside-diphosphate-sugar epimerase
MHILITGATGMIGRKLTERLVTGPLNGQAILRLTLTDVFAPDPPFPNPAFSGAVDIVTGDLATPGVAAKLVGARPDIIFHTAGIVSAERSSISRRAIAAISTACAPCWRRCARPATATGRN